MAATTATTPSSPVPRPENASTTIASISPSNGDGTICVINHSPSHFPAVATLSRITSNDGSATAAATAAHPSGIATVDISRSAITAGKAAMAPIVVKAPSRTWGISDHVPIIAIAPTPDTPIRPISWSPTAPCFAARSPHRPGGNTVIDAAATATTTTTEQSSDYIWRSRSGPTTPAEHLKIGSNHNRQRRETNDKRNKERFQSAHASSPTIQR